MKQIYLIYNSILEEYLFSESHDPYSNGNRITFKEEEMNETLKSLINPKRKSLLTLIDLKDFLVKNVETLFQDSKISVVRQNRD